MARINPQRRAEIGQQKRSQTNSRIVDAALRVIAAKGIHLFSIDDVVTEAGISRGSFYNYYPDRAALVTGIADRLHDIMGEEPFHFDEGKSMRDNLVAYLRRQTHFLRKADEHRDWGTLINETFASERTRRPFMGTHDPAIFFGFMRRLGESGFIAYRSIDAIYDFFIGFMYFTMARIVAGSGRPADSLIADFHFHVLLAFGLPREQIGTMIEEAMVPEGA
jgi:AcrR family transcriptional regulator